MRDPDNPRGPYRKTGSGSPNQERLDAMRRFRERIIRLPEGVFLDLVRNYVGEIKTPFHKQELFQRLEALLHDDGNRKAVVALLSLEDRRLLSALELLEGATEEEAFRLTGSDYSFLEFHQRILNLEDRLLIFRDIEAEGALLLNPHLEEVLKPVLSRSLVLLSEELSGTDQEPTPLPWFNDLFLVSFLIFLQDNPDVLAAQSKVKKKAVSGFLKIFDPWPEAKIEESGESGDPRLVLCLQALRNLGLVVFRDGSVTLNRERIQELAGLETDTRLALLTASAVFPQAWQEEILPFEGSAPQYYSQSKIVAFGLSLRKFLQSLSPTQAYPPSSLYLLWVLHKDKEIGNSEPRAFEQILSALVNLRILRRKNNGFHSLNKLPDAASGNPSCTVEGTFHVTLLGNADFSQLYPLVFCAELRRFGHSVHFFLSKPAAQRGFGIGITLEDLFSSFRNLGVKTLPPNIDYSLKEWWEDHNNTRFVDGILLIAKGHHQTVAEHLDALEPFILERPAPGLYLLDRYAKSEWVPLLKQAGFQTSSLEGKERADIPVLPRFESLGIEYLRFKAADTKVTQETEPDVLPPLFGIRHEIIQSLKTELEGMDLDDETKEELTNRINKGLILRKGQLQKGILKLDVSEARGLDYQAKVRVIEQAVKLQRDYLEITQSTQDQQLLSILIFPLRIKNLGQDSVLLAKTVPEGKELSIYLRRILSVKKIRSGILY